MNFALQKTLELVLIIGLGVLLQKKVAKQDLKSIKVLILSVALPATIFVALLIIGIFSFSEYFINPLILLGLGTSILAISFAPDIFKSTSFMLDCERKISRKILVKKSHMTITKNDYELERKQ